METIKILKWLWQLPQNICGLVYKLCTNPHKVQDGVYRKKDGGSVSLGDYIFLGTDNDWVLQHELGHRKQSLILGPLYLLIIGLPSLMNASMGWTNKERYYSFYTEAWANKLAGIKYTNEGGWGYVITWKSFTVTGPTSIVYEDNNGIIYYIGGMDSYDE